MDEYQTLMEELEELEDVVSYDKAKLEDDGERILLSYYLKTRKRLISKNKGYSPLASFKHI
jgi:hypothetical protein